MRTIAIFGLALLPTFAWAATGNLGISTRHFRLAHRAIPRSLLVPSRSRCGRPMDP
jgi:hypothetical protein